MKLCVLGSGSRGNCIAVWEGDYGLLIDVGLSFRQSLYRLAGRGIDPGLFRHCLITHSHGDHHTSARKWIEERGVRMWCTKPTMKQIPSLEIYPAAWQEVRLRQVFPIGDWQAFATPTRHNAEGACTFVIRSPLGRQLGLFVETGVVSSEMWNAAGGSHAYVIEANHDKEMCALNSNRPDHVNERTMFTHLNNLQAAAIIEAVKPTPELVVLVHLSQENNDPKMVAQIAQEANERRSEKIPRILLSSQDEATGVFEI